MRIRSKSLTFRIFLSTFLMGALIYFICALLFISNLYNYFEEQIYSELETESLFLEDYVLKNNLSQLSNFNTKNRITLIHKNGIVYFDNFVDPSTLENHGTRTEFLGALSYGNYTSSRFSETMMKKTLYYAKQLESGDVLRISCDQHTVGVLILGMSQALLLMLIIAIIISALVASFTSKKIIEPLNKIDLENPQNADIYDELKPFTKRISEENFEKSQREELRKQFTANVSHELKTPLTSISGFAEILKNGGLDENTTKDFANTIYEESQRLINLVNDIIKVSKLDEKSICQEKEKLSLREIVKEVFEVLTAAAKQKSITLNLYGDQGYIWGVRSVIYEMLYNLVDNAIKYNKENGFVKVTIESQEEDSVDKKASSVRISVEDSGIGIEDKEKERIFERFYRVDKSRSKENGGTGLGLSIVKHAAKYHNANIKVNSQMGKGSEFVITFNKE
ncbi:MAG: hypothetical protein K5866_00710 [Treponema sp.]|nr:hypothetical protein [Treponema sp.]